MNSKNEQRGLRGQQLFATNMAMQQWLNQHAEPALLERLTLLNEAQLSQLRAAFNTFGDLEGSSDLGKASGLMGRAIPKYLEIADQIAAFPDRDAKKAFIAECTVAQFRLMDRGLAGDGHFFMQDFAEHLPEAFPNGPEADLVRPLADKAADTAYDMIERRKKR